MWISFLSVILTPFNNLVWRIDWNIPGCVKDRPLQRLNVSKFWWHYFFSIFTKEVIYKVLQTPSKRYFYFVFFKVKLWTTTMKKNLKNWKCNLCLGINEWWLNIEDWLEWRFQLYFSISSGWPISLSLIFGICSAPIQITVFQSWLYLDH